MTDFEDVSDEAADILNELQSSLQMAVHALNSADNLFCKDEFHGGMDDDLENASIAAQEAAGDLDGMDERLSKVIEMLDSIISLHKPTKG